MQYQVFKTIKKDGQMFSEKIGEPVSADMATKRVLRLGGYATEIHTKKLLCQTVIPRGPHFVKMSVASGEDVSC